MLAVAGFLVWAAAGAEVRASWRCAPERVALGEPFALVLELEHGSETSARELAPGVPELGDSWVVLGADPVETTRSADGGARSRLGWRVASLEPGERSLAEALSSFALSPRVTRIQVGAARVAVAGVLGADEDAPRPLREFPEGFAEAPAGAARGRWPLVAAACAALLAAAAAVARLRGRRRRALPSRDATPLERLAEIERDLAGERGREGCFELTRLVRGAVDRLRARERGALDDQEWLAELAGSFEVPSGIVTQLGRVFAHTTRVKYAGEVPTPWALAETFAAARTALESVAPGGGK
jgi:hypothetical protein